MPVEKAYRFDTEDGTRTLAELYGYPTCSFLMGY
jgi:predicted dithiol-disulfide oxidoreductase (DUF899 family)